MSAGSAVVALFENADAIKSSFAVKVGIAQMLRGGVIMEVSTAEQACIAEDAGAVAVMVVVPDAIKPDSDDQHVHHVGGAIARMADPDIIKSIKKSVALPVLAKVRIGHFVEAQILEEIGVDLIDESETLACADDVNHINKHNFRIPFVCGCTNLSDVLCRMAEGASMLRTQGYERAALDVRSQNRDQHNIAKTVGQLRSILGDARSLQGLEKEELHAYAKRIKAPYELLKLTKQLGRLPVMIFAHGGVFTPADAAMVMQLGCDGVFLGHHLFEASDPLRRAKAFVQAVAHYNDSCLLAELSTQDVECNAPAGLPILNKTESADEDGSQNQQ